MGFGPHRSSNNQSAQEGYANRDCDCESRTSATGFGVSSHDGVPVFVVGDCSELHWEGLELEQV